MESVVRAIVIYLGVLLFVRFSGRRTLAELTTFDFILLLIISEATQQGLLGEDFSLTNALVLIASLILIDIVISLITKKWRGVDKWIEGVPMVIVDNGKLLKDRLTLARVDETDILEAARRLRGLENMSQIKYAVLEKSGGITIIPFRESNQPADAPSKS